MITGLIQELMQGGNRVLVVGLGITGIETALFLRRCGIECICVESTARDEYERRSKYKDRLEQLAAAGLPLHFGIEGESVGALLEGVRLAILSPGVSLESAIVGTLRRRDVRLLSELELGIVLAAVPSIIVTGSNGKTTTVSLIKHLLDAAGLPALLCGNVGTPIVSALDSEDVKRGRTERFKYLVVEASSYQLESSETLKPKISILLNLSDNHLERHGSMQRYFEAKLRAFGNQSAEDWAILNADDAWAVKAQSRSKGTIVWFGVNPPAKAADSATIKYRPQEGQDVIVIRAGGREAEFELANARLLGLHNRYDAAAALATALLLGAEPATLQRALLSFNPLEHRLELLGEKDGVLYINDSKSTTVAAAVAAFRAITESYQGRSIVLMIGGLAKAGSWNPLMSSISAAGSAIREVVCFGRDSKALASHCQAHALHCVTAPTLARGIEAARAAARPGDIVLLSPGCASFDEFSDFEDRGRQFKFLAN